MVVSIELGVNASKIGNSPRASHFMGNGGGIFEDDVRLKVLICYEYDYVVG